MRKEQKKSKEKKKGRQKHEKGKEEKPTEHHHLPVTDDGAKGEACPPWGKACGYKSVSVSVLLFFRAHRERSGQGAGGGGEQSTPKMGPMRGDTSMEATMATALLAASPTPEMMEATTRKAKKSPEMLAPLRTLQPESKKRERKKGRELHTLTHSRDSLHGRAEERREGTGEDTTTHATQISSTLSRFSVSSSSLEAMLSAVDRGESIQAERP